jgi:hypothetical protein
MKLHLLLFLFLPFIGLTQGNDSLSTFLIQLSPESCKETVDHKSVFKEKVDEKKSIRIIESNGIPTHLTGEFPNSGNPNTIAPVKAKYTIPLNPEPAEKITMGMGSSFGVLFSGVELDPYTNEFFQSSKGTNREWNITTLTSTVNLGLDCNNGHVQPNGKYHYHGTPNAYLAELGAQSNTMIKVGYAADGFPIYYKYGYNEDGTVEELQSGYMLKLGQRPGDGELVPDGYYDGTYFQDYEYVEGVSELDECNGRWGKTPESENEYYYVITDNFPSSPICFTGTPSDDFKIGGGMPGRNEGPRGADGPGGRPEPADIMRHMDTNNDNQISKEEARGPLVEHFDHLDVDHNGFLTIEELKNAGPPQGQPGRR